MKAMVPKGGPLPCSAPLGKRTLIPLSAALVLTASAAALAIVSLAGQQGAVTATALASLRSAGTWPNSLSAPSYEPHVGQVLRKHTVRDFHPRRPRARGAAAVGKDRSSQPPLVTVHSEREVRNLESTRTR